MRRVVIGVVIVLSVLMLIFALRSSIKPSGKTPGKKSEKVLNDALELKKTDPALAVAALEKIAVEDAETAQAQKALLEIASIRHEQGDFVSEQQVLKRIVDSYVMGETVEEAKKRIGDLNIASLFSRNETANSKIYEVKPGDTLYKIAKDNKTNVEFLMKTNNLDGNLIRPGMKLKVETSVFSIEVTKSLNRLLLKANGELIKEYPVGLGENNSTPVGQFKINNRIINPVWYKTGAIVPAGSQENILGTRWLGLSEPGYGIHGTTDPQPIDKQRTQGCVRMRNEDVEELFIIVPVGTEVIINE